jgi:hypothetical protein
MAQKKKASQPSSKTLPKASTGVGARRVVLDTIEALVGELPSLARA